MSSRNGRRHRKKLDEETEFKASPRKEDKGRGEEKRCEKVVESICIPQVEEPLKTSEKIEIIEKIEVKKSATPVPIVENQANQTNQTVDTVITIPDDSEIKIAAENLNGSNGHGGCGDPQQDLETELDLQLVDSDIPPSEPELDTEEQELQKLGDDNSDIDSHKGSPVLTDRCATRRSQTRNIPTPKTPRVHDNDDDKEPLELQVEQNGKLDENEKEEDVICLTPVQEEVSQVAQSVEENKTVPDSVEFHEIELPTAYSEKEEHNLSCASTLSTHVNVGSNLTREIDLSLPDENSFLNTAKDLTVVETLRRMSSRRAIRSSAADYRKTLLKSQAEKHEYVLQQQRIVVEPRAPATKRKTRSKTPENPKRFKTESSPGFFSYISSPMSMFRNRFGSGESMSASTPKLTAYREQEDIQDPELSKIEDASKTPSDKKRCVIM